MNKIGLTEQQVLKSRQEHGDNRLSEVKSEGFWEKLKGNFGDPMIKILCVALIINVVFAFLGQTEAHAVQPVQSSLLLISIYFFSSSLYVIEFSSQFIESFLNSFNSLFTFSKSILIFSISFIFSVPDKILSSKSTMFSNEYILEFVDIFVFLLNRSNVKNFLL